MKLAVVGTGYVGLVTGACFAEMGNEVICVDSDKEKIEKLQKGIIPIYEPGLETIVIENYKEKRLLFTTELGSALSVCNLVFIAVGTPMGEDGSADLNYVLDVARDIGKNMENPVYVVDKSTVPVGTAEKVRRAIQEELDKRGKKLDFSVISNPEFLKEGSAIQDFIRPDRIVIGTEDEKALKIMRSLYEPFNRNTERLICMDVKSAEMTKYAANAMLATKISFMNEIANICEKTGANVNKVRRGIGSDSRIGTSFIYAGCGYGGSCFPKDVQALIKIAESSGYEAEILKSVESVNEKQKYVIVQKVLSRFGENLEGKTFAVWGLAFKPGTDDMRGSSAINIIKGLIEKGAKIRAYDPKARNEAENYYLKDIDGITYMDSKYSVLSGADGLILVTEWKEFRSPDFDEISKRLKSRVIFDGRNQFNEEYLKDMGFEYYQIGVS